MPKKFKRKFKKGAKKVKSLVPDQSSLNPLAKKEEESPDAENVPRITNETIAVHREEVLRGARKYIYPLQHSKNRIIMLTTWILVATIVAFLIYSTLALYKFNQYNTFLYRTTQVVPFPIARIGDNFISYENYLFQLRHYVHYYQSQQGLDFAGDDKEALLQFRKQALDGVVNDAYVKMLAQRNGVKVADKEVNNRIDEVRNQNRLGSNDKVFADVLHDYWGWSVADFRRSLKQEILAEKVVAKLDTQDMARANAALIQAKKGADFGKLASKLSDDQGSKANGGDYGFAITKTNPNVPPQVVDVLFKLKPGQISYVINTGTTLEVVKLIQVNGNSVTAKHIVFKLKDVTSYIKPLKDQKPVHTFVKF